jgi:hypothetical protein
MAMTTFYRFLVLMTGTLAVFAWASTAGAVSTDVVLNLEGNPTCSSLGPNNEILTIKITSPGDSGLVEGPPLDGEDPQIDFNQKIIYSIDPSNAVEWRVIPTDDPDFGPARNLAVNYVILKGKGAKGGGTVYHYGSMPGSAGDGGLVLFPNTDDEGIVINALSFCYGLSDESGTTPPTPPPPVVEDRGNCSDLTATNSTSLDGTTFVSTSCPPPGTGGPGERIIVSFDPNSDDFKMEFCTCNLEGKDENQGTFEQCDPTATQTFDQAASPDVCTNGKGFVRRVPISILGVEDPDSFLCFAATGSRDCFFHFSDK